MERTGQAQARRSTPDVDQGEFVIEIGFGNDDMKTTGDVATALRRIADQLDDGLMSSPVWTPIRSASGEVVGRWIKR
jgi:hypothetical protein